MFALNLLSFKLLQGNIVSRLCGLQGIKYVVIVSAL